MSVFQLITSIALSKLFKKKRIFLLGLHVDRYRLARPVVKNRLPSKSAAATNAVRILYLSAFTQYRRGRLPAGRVVSAKEDGDDDDDYNEREGFRNLADWVFRDIQMEIKIKGESVTSVAQKRNRDRKTERAREKERELHYPFNMIFFSVSAEGKNRLSAFA
ncbi:hypothetical protein QTP88_016587 [Uroleucon formosanum]